MRDLEAERWLFEEGEWVPAAYVVPFLGEDAANQLARWASQNDGQKPILRTRARVYETRREDGTLVGPRHVNQLHAWFWKLEPSASNCLAGNFDRKDGAFSVNAVGVELNKDDLDRLIGPEPPRSALATLTASPGDAGDLRAALPPNATRACKRDAEYAHAAAANVRANLKLSEAIRQVAPEDAMRDAASIERGIRHTFNLMYDAHGYPISVKK